MTKNKEQKNIILLVGGVGSAVIKTLGEFKKNHKGAYRLVLIKDKRKDKDIPEEEAVFDFVLKCNFASRKSIVQTLKPIENELVAVSCRAEAKIPTFAKVLPHLPYLKTPSSESLEWTTDKSEMRKRLEAYNPKITPPFSVVRDTSKETLEKINTQIGFPLVIKPLGLAQSLLVTICFHEDELERALKKIFKRINVLYKENQGRGNAGEVLVEHFMEGEMYSIDAYVDSRGKIYFCPPVHIKTGRAIGFDDFFGYQQITPTRLSKESIQAAEAVSKEAIYALGLRSSTAHIELYKTEEGWKIIELGPRVGGFRDTMYRLSYGIDHTENDLYIRIPKKPKILSKVRGTTATLKVFAKKEGVITSIKGVKKLKDLESFYSISVNKKVGDKAIFAKHGGKSVFNITFFNQERSKVLADIRRMEQTVKIEVK